MPKHSQELIARLEDEALKIRRRLVRMIYQAGSGHPGGSLSATDVIAALYFHVLNVDPKNPSWEDRDRFVLSKGHACPAWYAALAERGFFPIEELDTFKTENNELGRNARAVIRRLDALREGGNLRDGVPLREGGGSRRIPVCQAVGAA